MTAYAVLSPKILSKFQFLLHLAKLVSANDHLEDANTANIVIAKEICAVLKGQSLTCDQVEVYIEKHHAD